MNTPDHATFDESDFPPSVQKANAYWEAVSRGYVRMQRARVMIAGLARNVADVLPMTIERMERLGKRFLDYRVAIYENDSSDDTPLLLRQWQEDNPRVQAITTSLGAPLNFPERCLQRADRMAYYRSQLQSQICQHRTDMFDYVILVDTDLKGGWSLDGVANTFGQSIPWDFVGSYGIIYKRKILAPNELVHFDAWAYRNDKNFTPIAAKKLNQWLFSRGDAMIPLYSCFGGLGIYTQQAYRTGVYDGNDIEHVGFHRSLMDKGLTGIFMNPSQITVYGRKHRKLDRLVAYLSRLLQELGILPDSPWRFPAETEPRNAQLLAERRSSKAA